MTRELIRTVHHIQGASNMRPIMKWLGVLVLAGLAATAGARAQDRPPDGQGSVFVDELGRLNLFLVDLQGDFLRMVFTGNPGDFIREAPDGRRFLHAEQADAALTLTQSDGTLYAGTGRADLAQFVNCPVFEPLVPRFSCFWPADGDAVVNAGGRVLDKQGRRYDLQAHLTGIFLKEQGIVRTILNDISVRRSRFKRGEPVIIEPTHFASVPTGMLITVDEQTGQALPVGDTRLSFLSGLALSSDGRLFGSTGFGGGGFFAEIDPATGTLLSGRGIPYAATPGLDFAPEGSPFAGTLFGAANRGGGSNDYFLITFDPLSGMTTEIGPILVPFVDAIVFVGEKLYGAAFTDRAVLIEINPNTGLGSIIGPIGFIVVGLEESASGLIGSVGGADPASGSLVRIDPLTGAGTLIGPTGFSPVSGLAKLPEMPDLEGLQ
jgi:hypothetical protein